MYVKAHLQVIGRQDLLKRYEAVADLLGPIGKPALDDLLEGVWFAAVDEAEQPK